MRDKNAVLSEWRKLHCVRNYSNKLMSLRGLIILRRWERRLDGYDFNQEIRWQLNEHVDILQLAIAEQMDDIRFYRRLPFIRHNTTFQPRVIAFAGSYLEKFNYIPEDISLRQYVVLAGATFGRLRAT